MIKRDDFIKMLDEIAEVVKRDPSQLLNPKSDFRNKLHEFRTWQNEYTKRKMCSFCQKKLKLKDLSHHQKVTLYTSGLCPECDEADENKSIFNMSKKDVTN